MFTRLVLLLSCLMLMPVASAGWTDWLQKVLQQPETQETAKSLLSDSEIIDGLKEALVKGIGYAIDALGKTDGFMGNDAVRIPVPESIKPVTDALKKLGQDKYVDDFHLTLNRAAEAAIPDGKALLLDAIRNMSIEDARNILDGSDHAATDYFRKVAGSQIHQRIMPIIQQATDAAGVTSAYKGLLGQLGPMASMLGVQVPDLDDYIARQALDGLFLMIAQEEKNIRENPLERTSDLLKKVFAK